MGFDLHHGRLDPRSRNDLAHLLQVNIRQADRLAATMINEALERVPRLGQPHPAIIYRLTVLIPRVPCSSPGRKAKGVWMR